MIADRLAEFITKTSFQDLPENTVTMAKNCIIDWMGSSITGAQYPPAEKIGNLIEKSSDGLSTLFGTELKAAPVFAALYNGTSSHTVELDDLHRKTMLHPGATIISAAWTAAEHYNKSGKDLIAAVALGYEIAIRVAESVAPSHLKYWYPTGTCGIFGAAAAVAKVLGLGQKEIVYALGNAGTQSAGLWEFHHERAMSKQLIVGKAAMGGALSAILAGQGFSGPSAIFEGKHGFLKAYSEQPRPVMLEQGLGHTFKIMETSFKLYPSGRHTHGGIDLALRLRDRGIKAGDIELIRIKTYRFAQDLVSSPDPYDPVDARFSLPFCVATTLVYGHPTLQCFCQERIEDEDVRRVMAHTTVEVDPELEMIYPNFWPTSIEIIDRSSHIIKERTDYPKGDPENPASPAEIHQKFIGLVSKALGREKSDQLLDRLLKLEQKEVRNLFD